MTRMRDMRMLVVSAVTLAVLGSGFGLGAPAGGLTEPHDVGPVRKIQMRTAPSFVIVSYHLKKSDRPQSEDDFGPDYGRASVLRRVLNKNATDVIGVIISDEGEIFTFDKEPTHPDMVERITVRGADGTIVPARSDRLLLHTPARIVRIEGDLPDGWKPLEFVAMGEVTPETKLYVATMGTEKRHRMYVKPCEYGYGWGPFDDAGACLLAPGVFCAGVLCNQDAEPVGLTSGSRINLGPGRVAWRGHEVLADPGVSDEQQKRIEDRIKQDFAKNLYEVRILPRPEPKEEEAFEFRGGFPFARRQAPGAKNTELLLYGLGFAEKKLLLPQALEKDFAAGIDTITVRIGDRDVPARFGGVLRQLAATVIELEESTLPQLVALPADGRPTRVEPFWAVYARDLAGMDLVIEDSRWIDREQGYADVWYPEVEEPLLLGSWLLDREGKLVGFFSEMRLDHDRLAPYLLGADTDRYRMLAARASSRTRRVSGPGWQYGNMNDTRLFDAAELATILAAGSANYDPHIRHLSEDEQKRRLWLGVEYTTPDKEMIKQMDLREPTQDGRIGLMVNRVYAGSSAAEMGLTEGDILLTLEVPDAPWPIELQTGERGHFDIPDFDAADIPKEFEAMGLQMPRRRPWPSRGNYLTGLLASIGRETTVRLRFLHGGETQEKEFTIRQAPRDMLSAAKYKDEALGLTAKDVTYEVRAALRLGSDERTVVVTNVEQGTAAALARISKYELIRAVDGASVDSVATLEALIAAAREAKKDSVRLTVERMGKTRLADLKLEAGAPGGLLDSLLRGR